MARPKIDFDNPVVSSGGGGGFQAGAYRVDAAKFQVFRRDLGKQERAELEKLQLEGAELAAKELQMRGDAKLVFTLDMTRLNDDGDPILAGDDDHEVTETKHFGLGGKALMILHPGQAEDADDEEPGDQGTEDGAEGNTVYAEDAGAFQIHNKSGFYKLQESAIKAGMKPEIAHRLYAPDWVGMVLNLEQEADPEMMMDKRGPNAKPGEKEALRYVVISSILSHGGKTKKVVKSAAKPAAGKSAAKGEGAEAGGADAEVQKTAIAVMREISKDQDGETVSVKAVLSKVSAALTKAKKTAQVVPVTTKIKDSDWLTANAEKFDATYDDDERTLTFGS